MELHINYCITDTSIEIYINDAFIDGYITSSTEESVDVYAKWVEKFTSDLRKVEINGLKFRKLGKGLEIQSLSIRGVKFSIYIKPLDKYRVIAEMRVKDSILFTVTETREHILNEITQRWSLLKSSIYVQSISDI